MPSLDQLIEHQRGVVAQEEENLLGHGIKPTSLSVLAGSSVPITEQRAHLDALLARKTAQENAIATHAAAKQKYAGELGEVADELSAARGQLADIVSTAITALHTAWTAAETYDELLTNRAAWLRSHEMLATYQAGNDDEVNFDTGAHTSTAFGRPHLILARQSWHAVGARQVIQYAVSAATAAHQFVDERRTSPLHELLDPVTARPEAVKRRS